MWPVAVSLLQQLATYSYYQPCDDFLPGQRCDQEISRHRRAAYNAKDCVSPAEPAATTRYHQRCARLHGYLEQLRKTSPNSKKPRTFSPVLLPVLLNHAVHVLSSSSSTGSRLNTASTSKQQTALSVLFIFLNRLTYVHPCMPVIPLVPSDSPTLISSLLRLSAHHLALAASASQPLKSGTLSLYLSVSVPVLIPFVVTSRPTTVSRPSKPLNPSLLVPRLC